jgi:putative nucleotidyltransferase with HDIG domain
MSRRSEHRILLVGATWDRGSLVERIAARNRWQLVKTTLDRGIPLEAYGADCVVFDVSLNDPTHVDAVRSGYMTADIGPMHRVFLADESTRSTLIQAQVLGANDVVRRVDVASLLRAHFALRTAKSPEERALAASQTALAKVFSLGLAEGQPVSQADLDDACQIITGSLSETDLATWISQVRTHHSQTFQHCLLVTGVAVAFGNSLGVRPLDLKRLAMGALVHDVGKSRVPLHILEKPGPLDAAELAIMREHPITGRDILQRSSGFDPEMVDLVAHHHELLDGSGYPYGLAGGEIADLVRVITISDIFAALIENRPYKAPLSNDDAFAILEGMSHKLDLPLVKAFRQVALGAAWAQSA